MLHILHAYPGNFKRLNKANILFLAVIVGLIVGNALFISLIISCQSSDVSLQVLSHDKLLEL